MTRAPHVPPLAFASPDEVIAAIRRRGGRMTASRKAVLELLFAADAPLSAEQIAERRSLEPTTVYRALESLEELGAVRHVHLGHGPGLYALTGGTEYAYLVCERCERVAAVPAERLDRVRSAIRRSFGYEARFSHFPIVGLCAACAAGRASEHEHDRVEHGHAHR